MSCWPRWSCWKNTAPILTGPMRVVEPRQIQEKTNQANAAGSDFNADHMESNHEPVSERQSRTPLKELGDVRADIQGIFLGAHGGQVAIP